MAIVKQEQLLSHKSSRTLSPTHGIATQVHAAARVLQASGHPKSPCSPVLNPNNASSFPIMLAADSIARHGGMDTAICILAHLAAMHDVSQGMIPTPQPARLQPKRLRDPGQRFFVSTRRCALHCSLIVCSCRPLPPNEIPRLEFAHVLA